MTKVILCHIQERFQMLKDANCWKVATFLVVEV